MPPRKTKKVTEDALGEAIIDGNGTLFIVGDEASIEDFVKENVVPAVTPSTDPIDRPEANNFPITLGGSDQKEAAVGGQVETGKATNTEGVVKKLPRPNVVGVGDKKYIPNSKNCDEDVLYYICQHHKRGCRARVTVRRKPGTENSFSVHKSRNKENQIHTCNGSADEKGLDMVDEREKMSESAKRLAREQPHESPRNLATMIVRSIQEEYKKKKEENNDSESKK